MPKHTCKFSDATFLSLYKKGMTDKEIADKLGVTQSAINYRREKLQLPTNYSKNILFDKDIIRMNKEGLTDKEIAHKLGVSQSSVNYRRQRLGLDSNYSKNKFSETYLIDLYHLGYSDREIAEKIGVTPAAINYRRERLGLKSNSKATNMQDFSSLYFSGYPVETIANIMRISMAKAFEARDELLWKGKPTHIFTEQEGL